MPRYELLMWGLKLTWALFAFALGACVGSLTNVLVYRMPLGISVVWPPSRCPKCDTRLSWRDNIPILGWLFLRGRCRYCRNPISPEYPIVELAVALLFTLFYAVWYLLPDHAVLWGIDWGKVKPVWAQNPADQTWPTFLVLLTLLGSLVAMTIIDAKTFTIPLKIMWVPAIVAVLVHPLHALLARGPFRVSDSWAWGIVTPARTNWPIIWATLGATVGLGLSNLMLLSRLIRPSFADYAEWEKAHLAAPGAAPDAVLGSPDRATGGSSPDGVATRAGANSQSPQGNPDHWLEYPHARREMVLELAFLAPCLALALGGWYLGKWWLHAHPTPAPISLTVLSGVLLGYLLGGGLVWAVRILGSLGFGREAMGLGDVHLMAAVGACLGWIDPTLAFFGAAFVGLAWTLLAALSAGKLRRMMPYGPFLAVSTVLVLLARPLIESGLSAMFRVQGTQIRIP